jgi:hypothetical protein
LIRKIAPSYCLYLHILHDILVLFRQTIPCKYKNLLYDNVRECLFTSTLHFTVLICYFCKITDNIEHNSDASNFRHFIEEYYETQPSEIELASCRKYCFGETMILSRLPDCPYSFTRLNFRFSRTFTQQYQFHLPKRNNSAGTNFSIPVVTVCYSLGN